MIVEFSHPYTKNTRVSVGEKGLTIGRSPASSDFACSWDSKVSRRHGRLWIENGELWYEDLGSSNGSWFNNERLTSPVRVAIGSPLMIGATQMVLLETAPAPTVAQEARTEPAQVPTRSAAQPEMARPVHSPQPPPPPRPTPQPPPKPAPRAPAAPAMSALHEGMTLTMHGKVGRGGLADVLNDTNQLANYMGELSKLVNELLRATDSETIAETLKGLHKIVFAAQRVYVVAWPAEEDGSFRHLVPPNELAAAAGEGGGVSRSLVSLAVERREALLFSESAAQNVAVQHSTRMKGIRSAVYVPLITSEDEILGVFCVDCPIPSLPFDEDSFQFLRAVGGLLGATLEADKLRSEARQRELESRNAEARRESLANFLKIASHDLKNPLTVVRACSRLIKEVDDIAMIHKLNSRIIDAEARAENLIKAYLEVSALESEQALQLELESLDLEEAVGKEIDFIETAGRHSAITFNNNVRDITIKADPQKLSQVLNNLIGNAAKYTRGDGSVTVRAESKTDGVVVSVIDEGVGISEEDQQKLFKEFQRVGDRSMRAGTGLGLWLTNALVQAHGGKVWVESKEGKGSTFYFSIPTKIPTT